MPKTAIVREISDSFDRCQLTHRSRVPINVDRARRQHMGYVRALRDSGCDIVTTPQDPTMPDCVFVEDIAVVVREIAVITRPGAEARRSEASAVQRAVSAFRDIAQIENRGTLDGGDVLIAGKQVFVGLSSRTNREAGAQLADILGPFGYSVTPVPISRCLHLKSAVTTINDATVVINPEWVDRGIFHRFEQIAVDPGEPDAANVLAIGNSVLTSVQYARTRELIETAGFATISVESSEIARAEGGLTCCSVVFEA